MTRVDRLNSRYAAVAALVRSGVEIIAVGDPAGAAVSESIARLERQAAEDGSGVFDGLLAAGRALRWRLATHPQPASHNHPKREAVERVLAEIGQLRGAVLDDFLLDDIERAAALASEASSPVGDLLMRSVEEVGHGSCVVVAASRSARSGLEAWLGPLGTPALTAGELQRVEQPPDVVFVVGPPRLYSASLVTAPVAEELAFVIPGWIRDHSVPRSSIALYAEGPVLVGAQLKTEGDLSELESGGLLNSAELRPTPAWDMAEATDREPAPDEVRARKVLLSGGFGLWLDDGERIRSLDPSQPQGERITYTPVEAVSEGTYLLVRPGETEHGALHQEAMQLLGLSREPITRSQERWKQELADRLAAKGHREVTQELRVAGVASADRVRSWVDPYLIRPLRDSDFEKLLEWLEIPLVTTIQGANELRRKHYQASVHIREGLEAAVSSAGLGALDESGHLSLQVEVAGVRGILAARVLAISPYTAVVPRNDARVPFEDRSGQWLE